MPSKGQSQIIQFILFFIIGLALFLMIGGVFRGRVDIFADDIADSNRRLLNSYFSALAVNSLSSCKQCDNFNVTTRLSNTTAGAFTEISLNDTHLTTTTRPGGAQYAGSAHNVTLGINKIGKAISNRPIILTYSKNQNILELKVA